MTSILSKTTFSCRRKSSVRLVTSAIILPKSLIQQPQFVLAQQINQMNLMFQSFLPTKQNFCSIIWIMKIYILVVFQEKWSLIGSLKMLNRLRATETLGMFILLAHVSVLSISTIVIEMPKCTKLLMELEFIDKLINPSGGS